MAQAGRIATAHLFEHGHSDVAALTGVTHTGALAKAVDGWRSARQDAGLAAAAEPLRPSGRGHVGGYEFGLSWLPRKDRPTALFAATDGLAIGLLRAARELGVRVPEELAIVSCNGTDEAAFSLPTLTTVFHPIPAIGEAALDVLESILKGGPPAPSRSLPMALRSGRSCGCPSEPEHRTAP
jgi:LacI family transcriptional regulator